MNNTQRTALREAAQRERLRAVRATVAAGAALAIVAAAGIVIAVTRAGSGEVVGYLDGNPITRDEVVFQLERLERTTDSDGDPLAERVLQEIKSDKSLLILAREQGLTEDVDHADLLAAAREENERRAEAIANGEVVQGVTEFSDQEFYSHRLTELTTALEDQLSEAAGDPLWTTDQEVRAEFDADESEWSANATTYVYTQLIVPETQAATAGEQITGTGTLTGVSVDGARISTETYDGSASTGVNAHDQEVLAVLTALEPGQISAPVTSAGQVTYYQLDERQVDQDAAFTTYQARIRQSLIDDKFEQYLQLRVDQADLTVGASTIDAIYQEDVR